MSDATERLTKFVEVMERKFIRKPGFGGIDDVFHAVETGSPDAAECRVSDIRALLERVAELEKAEEDRAYCNTALKIDGRAFRCARAPGHKGLHSFTVPVPS